MPGGIWIIGVDDAHYYGCDDLSTPLAAVPESAFKLLLAHTPELYAEAAEAAIDLYLCGHTHAGQVRLPYWGPLMLNAACPRAYTQGRWRHGSTAGYTSAGVGCSLLPVRYNCPPEIAVIELARSGRRSGIPAITHRDEVEAQEHLARNGPIALARGAELPLFSGRQGGGHHQRVHARLRLRIGFHHSAGFVDGDQDFNGHGPGYGVSGRGAL